MAGRKVQSEDIIEINERYLKCKTYAGVARQTGFSPSTVKKYVIPGFVPLKDIEVKEFDKEIIDPENILLPKTNFDWNSWLSLTQEEEKELDELRKEIVL